MQRVTIVLIFILALLAGVVLLQIFLSKKESKWPGLVLPILSFLISFLYPLNMAIPSAGGFIIALLWGWIIANIPTYVLLAIYFVCREKYRKRKQLDKMNIQDLD